MMVVWKYPLEVCLEQTIDIPGTAEILSAQVQNEKICLWVKLRPKYKPFPRTILIVGTGAPLPERQWRFIDTVQIDGGNLVFHVFERME